MEEDAADWNYVSKRKSKKKLSKDIKSALKSKRKVTNFIDKMERTSGSSSSGNSRTPGGSAFTEDNDEDLQVLWDDGGGSEEDASPVAEMEDMNLENVTFDTAMEEESLPSDTENTSTSLPHMRHFDSGIQYRKLSSNSILVSIEPFKSLIFCGKALLQVLKGVVDIYGYRFIPNGTKYTVFSAKGHSSLLTVKCLQRNAPPGSSLSSSDLETCGVSEEELETCQGALIILEGFENEWCDGLRNIYPEAEEFIGPSITGIGPGRLPDQKRFLDKLGFQFIKSSSSKAEKFKVLEFPGYWEHIFRDLTTQFDCSTGKVCPFGGKGVGKSTFVKWLVNRFLSREGTKQVLFLDLDPGQTEFTPPGLISAHLLSEPILGPNFTHLQPASRSIYLGSINISDIPISYIKGVASLFEHCSTSPSFQGLPWVINTMGFSSGLGVHLACEIIKILRPHVVLQLTIDNDRRSFPFFLNSQNVSRHSTFLRAHLPPKYQEPLPPYHFLSVKSACNRERNSNANVWGPNAKTLRDTVLISYFAEKIGAAENFHIRGVVPLRVPLDSVAIGTSSSSLTYSEIIATLNGNLVALCEIADESRFLRDPSLPEKRYLQNAGEFENTCLGYGIVRAYDKQEEVLYILTPVQETDILLSCNVILAAGGIGLPLQFYVGGGKEGEETPYLMARREGTSTLHGAAKKFFVKKRVTHTVLKNCLV